jgi:hypothetical protein
MANEIIISKIADDPIEPSTIDTSIDETKSSLLSSAIKIDSNANTNDKQKSNNLAIAELLLELSKESDPIKKTKIQDEVANFANIELSAAVDQAFESILLDSKIERSYMGVVETEEIALLLSSIEVDNENKNTTLEQKNINLDIKKTIDTLLNSKTTDEAKLAQIKLSAYVESELTPTVSLVLRAALTDDTITHDLEDRINLISSLISDDLITEQEIEKANSNQIKSKKEDSLVSSVLKGSKISDDLITEQEMEKANSNQIKSKTEDSLVSSVLKGSKISDDLITVQETDAAKSNQIKSSVASDSITALERNRARWDKKKSKISDDLISVQEINKAKSNQIKSTEKDYLVPSVLKISGISDDIEQKRGPSNRTGKALAKLMRYGDKKYYATMANDMARDLTGIDFSNGIEDVADQIGARITDYADTLITGVVDAAKEKVEQLARDAAKAALNAAKDAAKNAIKNMFGITAGKKMTRPAPLPKKPMFLTGGRAVIYINNIPVLYAVDVGYTIETNWTEITGIDQILPSELVPNNVRVSGSFKVYREPKMNYNSRIWQANPDNLLTFPYISLEIYGKEVAPKKTSIPAGPGGFFNRLGNGVKAGVTDFIGENEFARNEEDTYVAEVDQQAEIVIKFTQVVITKRSESVSHGISITSFDFISIGYQEDNTWDSKPFSLKKSGMSIL